MTSLLLFSAKLTKGSSRLETGEEIRAIDDALKLAHRRGVIELTTVPREPTDLVTRARIVEPPTPYMI